MLCDNVFQFLTKSKDHDGMGVPPNKINMRVGFYGRGVVADGAADLGAPTKKWGHTLNSEVL